MVRLLQKTPGRDRTIILIPLPLGALALACLYLLYIRIELHRRLRRSWPAIVSRLSPAWNRTGASEVSGNVLLASAKPWVLYHDAGVMMEMADYAEHHARFSDHDLIAELRSHALWLRLNALKRLLTRAPLA